MPYIQWYFATLYFWENVDVLHIMLCIYVYSFFRVMQGLACCYKRERVRNDESTPRAKFNFVVTKEESAYASLPLSVSSNFFATKNSL